MWAAATSGLQIHSEQSGRGGGEWKGQVGEGKKELRESIWAEVQMEEGLVLVPAEDRMYLKSKRIFLSSFC